MKRKFLTVLPLALFSGMTLAATAGLTDETSRLPVASAESTIQVTPFENLDANRDGYLNQQEAQRVPLLGSNFDQIEFDGDGRIDKLGYYTILSMLTSGTGPNMPSYGVLDVNRDNTVSETEYQAFQLRWRQLTDAMNNGRLSIGLVPTPNTLDGRGNRMQPAGSSSEQGVSGSQSSAPFSATDAD